MLRPVLEYCHVIYHAMLSKCQEERLEALQRKALRIVLGFDLNYSDLLKKAGVETLKTRRIVASEKFAAKLLVSERFNHYFPLNNMGRPGMRNRKKFKKSLQEQIDFSIRPYFTSEEF